MTRFRKTLVPLLLGCASSWAHAQPGMPDEAAVRRFSTIIDAASRRHGVEEALVHALIFTESSYDPRAVSSQGAMGLMQLMPETARRYGVRDALDPAENVEGGARMLRELLDLFDDNMELALAAYNAGPNAVIRAGHRIPPYDETLAFVPRVLGHYRAYQASLEPVASNDDLFQHTPRQDEILRAVLAASVPPPGTEPEGPEHGKRPVYIASARRQRRARPGRIFGTGSGTPLRAEPLRSRRDAKSIDDTSEVTMVTLKRKTASRRKAAAPKRTAAARSRKATLS